jgi:L-arabinokinase
LEPQISLHTRHYPDVGIFLNTIQSHIGEDRFFSPDEKIIVTRSPGRLDLMGGNDDYTGGLVFEATIQEATRIAVQKRSDKQVHLLNPQLGALGWEDHVVYQLSDFGHPGVVRPLSEIHTLLQSSAAQEWASYVVGGVYLLMKDFPELDAGGLSILIESDIPIGKGVSSSAALEVASLKAIAAAYGIALSGVDLATRCQWIENAICHSASGVMDQISVVLGERDNYVPLLCQPCLPEALVHLPEPLRLWGIDSGVRHQVAGIEYEAARAATFMGYQMLCRREGLELALDETGPLPRWIDARWNGYLANLSPSEFRRVYEAGLPEILSGAEFSLQYPIHADPFTPVHPNVLYPVCACTRYAVEENHRVHLFVDLLHARQEPLTARTLALLGELMYQSHSGYTECGLGSDATDQIVEYVRLEGPQNGLYGAKITGGGAGGTVAVLGDRSSSSEEAFQRVVANYQRASGITPYVFSGSSPGADAFGVLELDPRQDFLTR